MFTADDWFVLQWIYIISLHDITERHDFSNCPREKMANSYKIKIQNGVVPQLMLGICR